MQSKKSTKEIGDEWELKAKQYLERLGYIFIESNYRNGRNEIDIIFKFEKKLIFVEVKYRKNKKYGNPEDFVDHAKLNRIKQAAEEYIYEKKWLGDIRFDIIALLPNETMHLKDIF